jgi:hypothetical protein
MGRPMKLRWHRAIGMRRRAEHAGDAAEELKAPRRQSERLNRTTQHNDYGQPGSDFRYAAGAGGPSLTP